MGAGKTVANGRSMIAPTAIDLRTGKVGTSGTDKSVPYRVQAKFCTNIAQLPGVRNDTVSTNVSIPGHRNKRIGTALKRL